MIMRGQNYRLPVEISIENQQFCQVRIQDLCKGGGAQARFCRHRTEESRWWQKSGPQNWGSGVGRAGPPPRSAPGSACTAEIWKTGFGTFDGIIWVNSDVLKSSLFWVFQNEFKLLRVSGSFNIHIFFSCKSICRWNRSIFHGNKCQDRRKHWWVVYWNM